MTTPAPERDVAWTPDDDPEAWWLWSQNADRREPCRYPADGPRWPWLIGRKAS
jgi:hypothetical protein